MAELNDDLILEIVKRLPLKYAKQCSVLNKNIRNSISHRPNFLPSYTTTVHNSNRTPTTFTSMWQEIRSTPTSTTITPLGISVTLDMKVSIIASCNGILLLRFDEEPYLNVHYVFNPTTSTITKGVYLRNNAVGLAVPENSLFKLVVVSVYGMFAGTLIVFRVIAPKLKPPVKFNCDRRFQLMTDDESRPVYAHGSLYWLGDNGRATAAFDVEKEEARLIDGPVGKNETTVLFKWFGFADGAVHFVYASASEIVICRHDHLNDEWCVRAKHRMSDICNPSGNGYWNGGVPLFSPWFSYGRRVLFRAGKSGIGGDIYFYDLAKDWWYKTPNSVGPCLFFKHNFFSYTSSYVEVSDTYFNEKNIYLWKHEGIRNALLGLQKLFMPTEN